MNKKQLIVAWWMGILISMIFLLSSLLFIFRPISQKPKSYKVADYSFCSIRYSGVQKANKCEMLAKLFIGEKEDLVKKNLVCDFNIVFKDKYGFELGKCIFEGIVLKPKQFQTFQSSFWLEKEKIHQITDTSWSLTLRNEYLQLNNSF